MMHYSTLYHMVSYHVLVCCCYVIVLQPAAVLRVLLAGVEHLLDPGAQDQRQEEVLLLAVAPRLAVRNLDLIR